MKDTEFIELLNLYLDSEISPADVSRLEAEVQRNPEHYRVYQQYCRMQKACTLLAADFTSDTPTVVALQAAPRRAAKVNLYAVAGLMAAAACAAFVFVHRSPSPVAPAASTQSQVTAVAAPPAPVAPEAARTIAQTVTVSSHRMELKPVLGTAALFTDNAATAEPLQDERLDWIKNFPQFSNLPQVPADSLRFGPHAPLKPNSHSFGSGSMQATPLEVGFQFQR